MPRPAVLLWTLVVLAPRAEADFINGGFESGFVGYTTSGDTSIVTASFGSGPTQGRQQALLTTAGPSDIPPGNAVGTIALENFLGVPPGSLSTISNSTFGVLEGSALRQTFTANAGDTLRFDFNFLSDEPTGLLPFNDLAFAVLNGTPVLLADVNTSTFVASRTRFAFETGFQTFSAVLPTTGTYTFGIGVADVDDFSVDSGLLVDNVQLTAAAVPEPSSLMLACLGILSLLGYAWRQRKPVRI